MAECSNTLFLYERMFDTHSFSLYGDYNERDRLKTKLCKLLDINEFGNANFLDCICESFDRIGVKRYINEKEIGIVLENKIKRTLKFYKSLYGSIDDESFKGLNVAVKSFGVIITNYNERLKKLFIILGGEEDATKLSINIKLNDITKVKNIHSIYALIKS